MQNEQDILAGIGAQPPTTTKKRTIGRHGELRYEPDQTDWNINGLNDLETEYQKRFGRPLPVRNRGQGAIHNKWNLDHRDSADVGLNPDTPEGQQFLDLLEERNIPYLAFNKAIPGVATGPHTHVGRPSHRGYRGNGAAAVKPTSMVRPSPETDIAAGLGDTTEDDLAAGMQSTPDQPTLPKPATPKLVLPDLAQQPIAREAMQSGPVYQPEKSYDTKLTPAEEDAFQQWKLKFAPNDSGADYDLRGAFKSGLTPDPKTGHWPDTYKKPNHPTFSNESQYATGEDSARAGHWEGDTFVPANAPSQMQSSARVIPRDETHRKRLATDTRNIGPMVRNAPVEATIGAGAAVLEPGTRITPGTPLSAKPGAIPPPDRSISFTPGQAYATAVDPGDKFNTTQTTSSIARRQQQERARAANSRRQQLVEQLRSEWTKEAEETAKNAAPDLAKKILDAPRNANTADVIKYARNRGLTAVKELGAQNMPRLFARAPNGGFKFKTTTFHNDSQQQQQADQDETSVRDEARRQVISRQGGEENIARVKRDYQAVGRDPNIIDQQINSQVEAEVHRHNLAQLNPTDRKEIQSTAESILHLPGFLRGINNGLDRSATMIPATAAGITKIIGDFTNSDSIRDLAVEYQKEVNKRQIAQNYASSQLNGVNQKVEAGTQMIGDVVTLVALSEVLGPTKAMSMSAGLSTLGSTGSYRQGLKEGVKGGVYGELFKFLPYLEKYPGANSAAQKLANLGIDTAAVGTGTYTLERASGKSHDEALKAAITNSAIAGVMRMAQIVPDLKLAQRTIASESAPEWFREIAGKATGMKPAIVVNETGDRAASVYVNPQTGEQVIREIPINDPIVAKQRPTKVVADTEFENVIPGLERASSESTPPSSGVAPLNRQLESNSKAPTSSEKTPSPEPVGPTPSSVPETPETYEAQFQALQDGRREAVLVTPESGRPSPPKGMVPVRTNVGIFFIDPLRTDPETVKAKVADGTYGELLGHVEPKPAPGDPSAVVTAKEGGTEVQTSVVSPEAVTNQITATQAQNPQASVSVGGPNLAQQVIDERKTPFTEEEKPLSKTDRDIIRREVGPDYDRWLNKDSQPLSQTDYYEIKKRVDEVVERLPELRAASGARDVSERRLSGERRVSQADRIPGEQERRNRTARRIKELRQERRSVARAAEVDELTGVANQKALIKATSGMESDPKTTILSLDVRNLKAANSILGREAGDQAIKDAAAAMQQAAKENGVSRVFRDSGDEIIAGVPNEKAEAIRTRAKEIFKARKAGEYDVGIDIGMGQTRKLADKDLKTRKTGKSFRTIDEVEEPISEADMREVRADQAVLRKVIGPDYDRFIDNKTREGMPDAERSAIKKRIQQAVKDHLPRKGESNAGTGTIQQKGGSSDRGDQRVGTSEGTAREGSGAPGLREGTKPAKVEGQTEKPSKERGERVSSDALKELKDTHPLGSKIEWQAGNKVKVNHSGTVRHHRVDAETQKPYLVAQDTQTGRDFDVDLGDLTGQKPAPSGREATNEDLDQLFDQSLATMRATAAAATPKPKGQAIEEIAKGLAELFPDDSQLSIAGEQPDKSLSPGVVEFKVDRNRVDLATREGADIMATGLMMGQILTTAGTTLNANGLTIRKTDPLIEGLQKVVNHGRSRSASIPELRRLQLRRANLAERLIEAIRSAEKHGSERVVLYLGKKVLWHELFHEASGKSAFRTLVLRHGDIQSLITHPQWETIRSNLIARGYTDFLPSLIEEAGAELAAGNYSEVGINREQAIDFMDRWFTSFGKQNGKVSLNEFREMANEATIARQQVYDRQTEGDERGPTREAVSKLEGIRQARARKELAPISTAEDAGDPIARPDPKQINSPEFKRWFGKSKVVNTDGKPLIAYHATTRDFSAFRKGAKRRSTTRGFYGEGIYFTMDPDVAASYMRTSGSIFEDGQDIQDFVEDTPHVGKLFTGGNIMPVYLRVEHPYIIAPDEAEDVFDAQLEALDDDIYSFTDDLQQRGFDGIFVFHYFVPGYNYPGEPDEIVVFDPSQIKSATGNRGTFDPNDPDLLASVAHFDEPKYLKTKTLFNQALEHYGELSAPKALSALLKELHEQHNFTFDQLQAMKPYVLRFIGERGETVDEAAHQAAHSPTNDLAEPTTGQKEAGNYQKGHVLFKGELAGLHVSIENPEGSIRKGTDPNGNQWSITLKSHYGYIRRTEGADDEHVDAFIKPGSAIDYKSPIFVVNQTKGNGHFDEHKAMIGWTTEAAAKKAYLDNYQKGWNNFSSIATFESPSDFKDWLADGDLKAPALNGIEETEPLTDIEKGQIGRKAKAEVDKYNKAEAFLTEHDLLDDFYHDTEAVFAKDGEDSVSENALIEYAETHGFKYEEKEPTDNTVSTGPKVSGRVIGVGTLENPNVPNIAKQIAKHFVDGNQFRTINDARKFVSDLLGQKVEAGTQAAKSVDEAVELGAVIAARKIVTEGKGDEQETFRNLVDLYEKQQPTLGVKTSTSVQNQAYSTPLPLAYIASRLAGVTKETTVYEPTAGNGALLIETNPKLAFANELNADRRANLETQDLARVEGYDAANDFTSRLVEKWRGPVDAVIANPPFGVVKEDGETKRFKINDRYTTSEIDHAIAMKALEAMKDDGSAVLILGGLNSTDEAKRSNGYSGKAKLEFYVTLYGEYNVVDHFTVNGDLYKKQGAGWPVDVIVIHGRGKSKRTLPAADVPRIYDSWDELEGVLDEPYRKSLDARSNIERPESVETRASGGRSGEGQVPSTTGPDGVSAPVGGSAEPASTTRSGPGTGVSGIDSIAGSRTRSAEHGTEDVRLSGRGNDDLPSRDTSDSSITEPVSSTTRHTGQPSSEPSSEPSGRTEAVRVDRPGKLGVEPSEPTRQPRSVERADLTQTQAPYRPSSKAKGLNTLVPLNMKNAIEGSLEKLENRVGNLDHYIATELGYDPKNIELHFSAEQVDALAMAIDNIKRGSGFIIGDQGGIGKGRVVAGVIRWALRNDKVPIFVTEKPNLYKDIVRDLSDIGEGTIPEWAERALMTNSDENVPLDDEETVFLKSNAATHKGKLEKLIREGSIEPHDTIFTTYNQMQTIKGGQRTIRQDFLQHFGDGAILIFDESHNAGGAEKKDKGNQQDTLDRALFARQLIDRAFGVFYSSATYAKRPQVMDLYSKTDMSKAVDSAKSLAPAIEKGGVPLQQAVAAMLAEAGQYVRRERDFAGLSYETANIEVNKAQAENTSAIMRAIMVFDEAKNAAVAALDKTAKAEGKKLGGDTGTTGKAGADSTSFTTIMHNLIGQMLLMLKTEGTIAEALTVLKANEKPVITVSNTMGSFIKQYVVDNGLKPGDAIGLSFGNMLRRYLERSRDVVIGKAFGPKETRRLKDEELGPAGLKAYNDALKMIENANWEGMPVSPIDYIKFRLGQEGYKLGEITGRGHVIDYQKDGSQIYRTRPASDMSMKGRTKTLVDFNNGNLNGLIINQAGSTGLSIHASDKFKDQRKRMMLIGQAELNIDTQMQMLYRVDRTGQVVKPGYKQLTADIPAEKRPAAILSKKMASLNANTTAAKGSAYEAKDVPDFMNEYGDEVVASIMEDDPALHKLLGKPLKDAQGSAVGLSREDAIRKVTGRIPLLPIDQQHHVYELIESEYRDLITRLDAMGENALEAKRLDLDAKLLKKTEIFKGKGESPFERGAFAEESDVKRIGKPYKTDQVMQQLKDATGSHSNDLHTIQHEGLGQATDREQEVGQRFQDYKRPIVDSIEDKQRAQAQEVKLMGEWRSWRQKNEELAVGQTIRMDTPLGELFGVVTKIEQKGKPKNPVAQGSWRATIAVADAVRQITIPLSKLHSAADTKGSLPANHYTYSPETFARILDREARQRVTVPIIEAFDKKQTESREHRTILTGNLLAAFGRFQKGRIINFTDEAGQVRQGIMMPTDFNLESALKAESVKFKRADDIIKFLRDAPNSRLVTTPDNTLRLTWNHNSLKLSTNTSKATGGQYFQHGVPTADAIMDAAGDEFVKSGSNMQMFVDEDRAADVINTIISKGFELETGSYKDEANRIIGTNPRRNQAGSVPIGQMLSGPPSRGYQTGPGKLRSLFDRVRGAAAVLRGTSSAKRKFNILGSLRDIWVGNLSQLEKANLPTFNAALRAAGAKTTGKLLMRRAAQQVQSILQTKNAWDLFRTALVESRLRGVRDRWMNLADLSRNLSDDDLKEFYAGGGEDFETGIRHLVLMLEGMPFGKQFKIEEGFDPDDSVAGMVDTLLATDDFNAASAYLSALFTRAAGSVATVMEPDDFDTFTGSRVFPQALSVYKDLLERPMNEAHSLNEGVFSDALGPLDTYYPLTALDDQGDTLHRVRTRVFRGQEYRPPDNPRNKMATGLAPTYDVTPEALGHAVSIAERRNSVANLLKVAEQQGLVRTLKRKEPSPDTITVNGEEFVAKTVAKGKDRTLFINGKTINVPAPRLAVPEWLFKELQPILEEGDYSQGRFVAFVSKLNQFGMAGPIDAAAHTANVVGALIVGTPYIGTDILSKTIGNTPVTKLLTAWVKIATTDPWTDNAIKDIEAMSKIGVIPSRYATVVSGWTARGHQFAAQTGAHKKYLSLAPMLYGPGGIDIRARLLMYRLAREAMPEASPAELKHFIDQLGNYTTELQGRVERWLKAYGVAPFYTAGSTMWRTGIKATFGLTPLPSANESRGKRTVLRAATLLSGGIVGIVGMWLIMYRAYTGKWPWEDERARLLQIPLNEKHRKHWLAQKIYGANDKIAYVSVGFFSPLIERGLRSTGITAAVNARIAHATRGQASEEWEREVVNSAIQPFVSGPATHMAFTFTTTKEPYITGLRDLTGQRSVNLLPAMKTKEPGAATLKTRTVETVASLNSFYGDLASHIGFVQRPLDLNTEYAPKDAEGQPNPFLRMIVDLAAPRLVKGPFNVRKQQQKFEKQEKAIKSAVRRDAGLPKAKRAKKEAGPGGPAGPSLPGEP